jgi:hypothetical protein
MTAEEIRAALLSAPAEILSVITDALKSRSADDLEQLYAPSAKLSFGFTNIEGAARIAAHLISKNAECIANSYDVLVTNENRLIITGTCTWGNEKRFMTVVVEPMIEPEKEPSLRIVNHIISASKI